MKDKLFTDKIKPLMDIVHKFCQEDGIEFLAEFKTSSDRNSQISHFYTNGDMVLSGDIIMSQYQKWEIQKNKRLEDILQILSRDLGIQLIDIDRNFRKVEDIMKDLVSRWGILTTDERSNLIKTLIRMEW